MPLAGITVLLIIGVLVWQHRADELRTANGRPNTPVLAIVDQVEELIACPERTNATPSSAWWRVPWMPTRDCGSS
ncbi:MAG TPA: hypothetical protein VK887_01980 [Pseudonocardiaceae bacterium]|nr:hypothetical protein [Pseudonocardiaceae bacterium]